MFKEKKAKILMEKKQCGAMCQTISITFATLCEEM